MLKGRGKTFAPKKGLARKPQAPSATSSARPSVERQSQTPAPSHPPQETLTPVVEDVTPAKPVEEDITAAVAPPHQTEGEHVEWQADVGVSQAEGIVARPDLKRKSIENENAAPPPKRTSTAVEAPSLPSLHIASQSAAEPSIQAAEAPGLPSPKSTPQTRIIPPRAKTATSKPIDSESQEASMRHAPPEPRNQNSTASAEHAANKPSTVVEQSAAGSIASVPTPTTHLVTPSSRAAHTPEQTFPPQDPAPEGHHSRSASPTEDEQPEAPTNRYPSPVNLVRLADDITDGSANMGRAGGGGSAIGGAGDAAPVLRPGELGQGSELVPMGVLNPDGTSGGIVMEEPASGTEKGKKKKKPTKRKKVQPSRDDDDLRATVEVQLNRPRRVAGSKKKRQRKEGAPKGRRARAETPEGASDEEIDQSKLTMADICKDLRIGKKFSMHDVIKQRVMDKKLENIKEKMRRNHPDLAAMIDQAGTPPAPGHIDGAPAEGSSSTAAPPAPPPPKEPEVEQLVTGMGPQMRIVDGNLVLDESSLQIDRQARAQEAREEMEVVEENDFTRVITSGTYMKRERAMLWDHAANERFYEGLSQFGTDFEMIAKLFPHRNRRQIKLKFNKEEKVNEARVTRALIGPKRKAINLDNFEKLADIKLEEVAELEAFHIEYEAEQLAKQDEIKDAADEVTRLKKAAIQNGAAARRILSTVDGDDDEEPRTGGDSAKENHGQSKSAASSSSKGKAKSSNSGYTKKPRKNKHSHYAGGEKVTILGTIEL